MTDLGAIVGIYAHQLGVLLIQKDYKTLTASTWPIMAWQTIILNQP